MSLLLLACLSLVSTSRADDTGDTGDTGRPVHVDTAAKAVAVYDQGGGCQDGEPAVLGMAAPAALLILARFSLRRG